jgi:hypothetical protein
MGGGLLMRSMKCKMRRSTGDDNRRFERSNDEGVVYAKMNESFFCANYHHINGIVVLRVK